jgi:hypothetical protein
MTEVIGGLFAPLVIMLVLIMVSERFVRGVIEALQALRSLISE